VKEYRSVLTGEKQFSTPSVLAVPPGKSFSFVLEGKRELNKENMVLRFAIIELSSYEELIEVV
jgi:hypothetical protein